MFAEPATGGAGCDGGAGQAGGGHREGSGGAGVGVEGTALQGHGQSEAGDQKELNKKVTSSIHKKYTSSSFFL